MSQQQYFQLYAEPGIHLLNDFPAMQFDQVVCIPAFNESPQFLDAITNSTANYAGKVLLALVINQASDAPDCPNNRALFQHIQHHPVIWQQDHSYLVAYNGFHILLIDRFSSGLGIPAQQGVGLARKIACDCAAFLYYQGKITSSQMFCSDADVVFPVDYFNTLLPVKHSAATLAFAHLYNADNTLYNATKIYEASLEHYVNGLKQAGSVYAFHTIGSCLLIDFGCYIKVRGFPRRPAGEDFYLLNKLQKIAPVLSLTHPVLGIQSRLSDRVPFGTGPAVAKLCGLHLEAAAIFYHPQCFAVLACWLAFIEELAVTGNYQPPCDFAPETCEYLSELAEIFDLKTNLHKIAKNHSTISARSLQLKHWFDGFRTMKAIHYLRDKHFPSMSLTNLQDYNNNT